jgi:hypothetical protein
MLLFLLLLIAVVVLPALAYVEYERWRGMVVVKPPHDLVETRQQLMPGEMNHDPPTPPDYSKRLPNITDIGVS